MGVLDKWLMRSMNASLLLVGHQINSAEVAAISVRHSTLTCNFIFPPLDSFSTCCRLSLASHVISQFFFVFFYPPLSFILLALSLRLFLSSGKYKAETSLPYTQHAHMYALWSNIASPEKQPLDTASVLLTKSDWLFLTFAAWSWNSFSASSPEGIWANKAVQQLINKDKPQADTKTSTLPAIQTRAWDWWPPFIQGYLPWDTTRRKGVTCMCHLY